MLACAQARSFSVSVSVSDYQASVRPVINGTWAEAPSPSRHWEFAVNLTGYQAPTDLVVWLPANAPGVQPPNGPSRRVWHEFVPPTAASTRSIVTCDTALRPPSSVRRGGPIPCRVAMVDALGDNVKGVVEQFHVTALHGRVSDIQPSHDHWTGTFKYTPPEVGDRDVVRVVQTATNEELVNGTTVFDVADRPSLASALACTSASWPPTTVLVGDRLNCSIAVRTGAIGSSTAVKGVPADFAVSVSFGDSPQQLPLTQVHMVSGGYALNFSVVAPAMKADGTTPVHELDVLVHLSSTASSIQAGSLRFDVAHQPFATDSQLRCAAVERFQWSETDPEIPPGVSEFDVIVATYETVRCVIAGHGAKDTVGGFPAKTLSSHYTINTRHGHVSELAPLDGGTQLVFWYVT